MKKPSAFVLVALSVGLFASVINIASAATPTPGPTTTPVPLPVALFGGTAWLNGQNSNGPIVAKIGQQVCGTAVVYTIPDDGISYRVEVASDQAIAGCGTPGATVTFFVAGQEAQETAVWQPGESENLTLIAGPSFSSFTGLLTINRRLTSEKLEAFAGNIACGEWNHWIGVGPQYSYAVNVLSNQQAGCGTEGASISFKMLDAQRNVIATANEVGVWHAANGISNPQQLNLTFTSVGGGGVFIPNVGSGGVSGGTAGLTGLALLLGSLGVIATAFGLALRRHATTD